MLKPAHEPECAGCPNQLRCASLGRPVVCVICNHGVKQLGLLFHNVGSRNDAYSCALPKRLMAFVRLVEDRFLHTLGTSMSVESSYYNHRGCRLPSVWLTVCMECQDEWREDAIKDGVRWMKMTKQERRKYL